MATYELSWRDNPDAPAIFVRMRSRRKGGGDDFAERAYFLPGPRKEAENKCPHCNGTGECTITAKFPAIPHGCPICRGGGWVNSNLAACTKLMYALGALFESNAPGHMRVECHAHLEDGTFDLRATLTPALRKRIASLGAWVNLSTVLEAMRRAHTFLSGSDPWRKYHAFSATATGNSGEVRLTCPDDAELRPTSYTIERGRAYELRSANVRTSIEALALLAGLAALQDLAS